MYEKTFSPIKDYFSYICCILCIDKTIIIFFKENYSFLQQNKCINTVEDSFNFTSEIKFLRNNYVTNCSKLKLNYQLIIVVYFCFEVFLS